MRAASKASLASGREIVSGADLGTEYLAIADQFFGVSDLLSEQTALVRALTSPSRDAEAKRKLARNVFGTLLPVVVQALEALAANRWSNAGDIVTASEDLGVEAVMTGAKAAGRLSDLETEIFGVAEFLSDHRDLRVALADTRSAVPSKRVRLAKRVFGEQLSSPTMTLLTRVVATVEHGRIHTALMRIGRRASNALATTMVIIEAATRPSSQQLSRLREVLRRRYQTELTMNVRINPELIGGIRVSVKADVIEGSVATALDNTRRALAGINS